MNPENEGQPTGAAFGVSDVMYILFRHKWKIILFTLLGLLGASGIWFLKQPVFESEAKILVKYVPERRAASGTSGDSEIVREIERGGLAVINSEVEILTSMDCVLEAVKAVGPQRILAAYGGGNNDYDAAGVILNRLTPKVGVGASGIVTISLGHRDPSIAREALSRLIEEYRKEHVRVHRGTETYTDLQAEADLIRERLSETERNLNNAKSAVNVISLEEEKLEISSQLSALRTSLFAAEAELAERRAELELAEGRFGVAVSKGTNKVIASNQEYPAEKLEAYKTLSAKLSYLKRRENELLLGEFAETSRAVGTVRQQIADVAKAIAALDIDPAKAETLTRQVVDSAGPVFNSESDVNSLRAKVRGLEARIEQLKLQRIEVQQNFAVIESAEGRILQLERSRNTDEERLRQYESNLEKARLDQAIDANKITNITVVQDPTPAGRNMMKLYKLMAGALFGMIGAGVALGFVIEMFIDGSLKRPKDVEVKAGVPLFVSIPCFGVNGRARLKLSKKNKRNTELQDMTGLIPKGEIAPWEPGDPMFDYYESLRDRVVMSYEGDPRKPKIVAVTSCNRGAGTTRISTGLAAALSRDVHRRVLYIGLEKEKVSVTAFYKGRPQAEFAPEFDNQIEGGQSGVAPELYSLVQTGHSPQGISIVQTFSDMIPKLRMSEYDYVIFDLPPVSETSGSLRLASQMERTLLIVESELTQKSKVERIRDLLSGTNTRMFAVLNKTRSYGPQVLTEQA